MSASLSRRLVPCLVALCFWMAATAYLCQSQQPMGDIVGKVKDDQGQTLAGATISLLKFDGGATIRVASTDSNGAYEFDGVSYGRYRLAASFSGKKVSEAQLVSVLGESTTVDFKLQTLSLSSSGNIGYLGSESRGKEDSFSVAGVEGTIAPSGYSAAATAEDTSLIMSRLAKLDDRNLSLMPIREPILSCDREGELLKAAQNHPKSFESNHALGVFYLEHGDGDQSIVYLKLAFAIEPRDTENARWLALAYLQSGQSSKAIDVIQSGANQQLTNPKMALLLAQIYKTSGNRLWAIAQYLSASSLDGGEENSFACGIGLVSLGATDQALKLFSQATRRNPNSAKLWMGLGIAQSLSNKKIESTYSLLKAADLDPGFLPTYLFLASLSGTSPETDTAIRKRLEALVVSNSERAEAHYDYAFALSKYLGSDPSPQLDAQVEAQLRIAIKRDPDFAPAHLKLGSLYEEEGNYPLAVGELERTVQLDPSDASAHYRLSQAYRRDNQPLKADSEMDQFKKIRPESLEDDDSTTEGLHVYAAQSAQNLTLAASCSSSQ